jgi:hypothetical protein
MADNKKVEDPPEELPSVEDRTAFLVSRNKEMEEQIV